MRLSKEKELLLYCTGKEIPKTLRNRVKALVQWPLDWGQLLDSAYWHGVAPLLYCGLKEIGNDAAIPVKVMNELKNTYHENLARNMYFYAELKQILKVFSESGIKTIVLKGAALAKTIYGDIGLRPMNDIDLLINKEDLAVAEKALTSIGYSFNGKEGPEWYKRNHFHISYISPDKSIVVEIHWHIGRESHPSRIALTDCEIIQGWWARSRSIEIAGMTALILGPEDSLFHLALHFLKHRFNSFSYHGQFTSRNALIQLCDIRLVLEHQEDKINWSSLKRETDKYRVTSLVYSTLNLADELLCNGEHRLVPNDSTVDDPGRELLELVKRRILVKEDYIPTGFFQSLAAGSTRERMEALLRNVFPRSDVLANRYSLDASSSKLYLYYLIHPLRMLLKQRDLLWRLVSLNKEIREEAILNKWMNTKN